MLRMELLLGHPEKIRGKQNPITNSPIKLYKELLNDGILEKSIIIENFLLIAEGIRDVALFYPSSVDEIEYAVSISKKFGTGFAVLKSPPGYRFITFGPSFENKIDHIAELNDQSLKKNPLDFIYKLGNIMGYPECCTKAFVEDMKKNAKPEKRYLSLIKSSKERTCKDVIFRQFVPCKPCCPGALEKVEKTINKCRDISKELEEIYQKSILYDKKKLIKVGRIDND